jgi:hypothetical protein
MENVQPNKREVATDKRKAYRKPQLVEYGQVGGLTQSGGLPYNTEGGIYTFFSG